MNIVCTRILLSIWEIQQELYRVIHRATQLIKQYIYDEGQLIIVRLLIEEKMLLRLNDKELWLNKIVQL